VIAPGIDVATILTNIADLGPYYEQVVLVGYPPFVKDVLDQAPAAVTDMDLKILMAGENISEGFRDYILKRIGKEGRAEHTCLIYGTADAGIMGHETLTTIAARRLARSDHQLDVALFGDGGIQPTFVEYQADFRFTETDQDGYLLFTIDNAFPLIRYRVNDRGRVVTASELARLISRCGHEFTVRTSTENAGFIALGARSARSRPGTSPAGCRCRRGGTGSRTWVMPQPLTDTGLRWTSCPSCPGARQRSRCGSTAG
jgi:phenylacetate-CoA ligase